MSSQDTVVLVTILFFVQISCLVLAALKIKINRIWQIPVTFTCSHTLLKTVSVCGRSYGLKHIQNIFKLHIAYCFASFLPDIDTSGNFLNLFRSSLNFKFHANVRLIYQIAKRLLLWHIFGNLQFFFVS